VLVRPLVGRLHQRSAEPLVITRSLPVVEAARLHLHQPAGSAQAHGISLSGLPHHLAPLRGLHHFFEFTSLRIWMSRAWSATKRLSRRFSSSSSFSRLASESSMPPNFDFQR